MSLFRRTFSRRLPDHLLEISERIYVFDSCLSTSTPNENEFKAYLGKVVASLQRFHAGASFMVFNFREGEEISSLADILIDYDMTVVDYPRNHEGHPLLPLEMINYFLRSSESWLSLEGQKNVILMHSEKGGWPVLAFMLAGLLLYRKQYNGELKTLEMVNKQAPKQVFSVLSPINARASQLRYLKYITGRDLISDWPPPDVPLVINCLLVHNLPLFDGGKGCRPVVRVYGQDASEKRDRDPRLLLSTLMTEESAWLYPKEECIAVKLELRCQVQGDVFIECIHLCDDLVTEELIFKVLFHTGFIQATNVLELNSVDIDVPWNAKYQLPKDFKAEVLFQDINEDPPTHITMELGGGEDLRDSDNEFFEAEEILTSLPSSPQKKADSKIIIDQEATILESKPRDCTLHNGAPRWDVEREINHVVDSKDIAFNEGYVKQTSESLPHNKDITVTEVSTFEDRDIDDGQLKQVPEKEADEQQDKPALESYHLISALKSLITDYGSFKLPEIDSPLPSGLESGKTASKNIIIVDDTKQEQASEEDSIGVTPSSGSESTISTSTNIVMMDKIQKQVSETESVISAPISESESSIIASNNIVMVDDMIQKQVPEKESFIIAPVLGSESSITSSKNVAMVDDTIQKQAQETKSVIIGASGSESEVIGTKNIVTIKDRNYIQTPEKETENSEQTSGSESGPVTSKNIEMVVDKIHTQALETEPDSNASENIVVSDTNNHKEASETQPEAETDEGQCSGAGFVTSMLKTVVDDDGNHIHAPEINLDANAPASDSESGSTTSASRNIVLVDDVHHKNASETGWSVISALENIVVSDTNNHKEASETQSEAETDEGQNKLFSGVFVTSMLKNIVVDDGNHIQAPEINLDVTAPASDSEPGSSTEASRNIALVDDVQHKNASETRWSDISALENIVAVDIRDHKEALGTQSEADSDESHAIKVSEAEFVTCSFTNIVVNESNHIRASEKEMDATVAGIGAESGISVSRDIILIDDKIQKHKPGTKSEKFEVVDIRNLREASESKSEAKIEEGHELDALKNVEVHDGNHIKAPEIELDVVAHTEIAELGINASKNIFLVDLIDFGNHQEAWKTQSEAESDEGHDIQASGDEFTTSALRNIIVDENYYIQALEKELDVSTPSSGAESGISASKNVVLDEVNYKQPSEIKLDMSALGNTIVGDIKNHKETSESESGNTTPVSDSESGINASENIVQVNDMNHKQASRTETDVNGSEDFFLIDNTPHQDALKTESHGHDVIQASGAKLVASELKNIVVDANNSIQAMETDLKVRAPGSGTESESGTSASKNIVHVDVENHKQVSERELDINASKNIAVGVIKTQNEASETQSNINATDNNVAIVDTTYKNAPSVKSEVGASKNIVVVDNGSQIQDVKVEIERKFVPSSSKPKQSRRNKWQEMTAKTITQQRVVSQWVPRTKQQAPEPAKPKPATYKWVPKGTTTPSGEK